MSFQIGDIVWVQIQGFPWWPAKVIEPSSDSVPSDVLAGRQGTEDTLVQFYSTKDYSWMVSSDQSSIRHFGQHLKLLQQPKMKNDISLKRAVGLAKKEYEQVVMGGQSVSPQTPTTTLTASVSDSNKNNNKKKVKSENQNNNNSDENNDDEKSRVKKVKSEHSKKRSRKQRDEGSDYEDNDDEEDDDEEEAAESEKKDRSKRKKSSNDDDDDDESDDDDDKTTKKQRTKKSTTTTTTAAAAVKKEPEKKKVKSEKLDVKSTTSSVKTETPKTPTKKSSTTATTPSSVSLKKEDSKTPTKKKSSDTKVKSEKLSDNSSVTKQEKQEKLTRVTLTDDQLEKCNAKLDRFINDGNNEKILEAVRFLHSECEPLTIAQLTKVKIGRTMKRLTKSSNDLIKQYSSSLVRSWTQLATGVQKSATQTPTPSSSVKTGGAKNSNSASSSPTTPTTPTNSSKSNNNKANEVDESLLNLTGDNMRDFARKKIANGLATGTKNHQKCASLAIMIEEAMFDHFGKKSTDEGYKTQMRSVAYNLADPSNPDFVQVVLMGGVPPSKVASMSSKDMASNELKAERERIQQEATRESLTATPAQTATSMFTCRRCKSQNCTYYQMQTRSADEPMTVFVTCLTCDTRWKC